MSDAGNAACMGQSANTSAPPLEPRGRRYHAAASPTNEHPLGAGIIARSRALTAAPGRVRLYARQAIGRGREAGFGGVASAVVDASARGRAPPISGPWRWRRRNPMATEPLSCPIGSPHEFRLQRALGTEARAQAFYRNQVLGSLNPEMMAFVAQQRMVFVASADASGSADCSPRFGPPGFVRILHDGSLCWPEYRGNGVLATLANLDDNPHVGLLFVDFERAKIGLHVNGRGVVRSNDHMVRYPYSTPLIEADAAVEGGRHPECWVLVDIEEAYIHCSKHIPVMRVLTRDEEVHWGTDDTQHKGGDYFRAR